MNVAIRAEGISKKYQLGLTHAGSVRELVNRLSRGLFRRQPEHNSGWPSGHNGFASQAGAAPGEFWALRDVSFEVNTGEVLGIIGSNGAGKSTLLKILSRICRPTTGRSEIHGRVGSLLEIGTGFHPELTGHENIYLNGSLLGMRQAEIKRKYDEIVEFSGVEDFLDTPVKRYSSGMRVRLGFAIAAHLEPEILIVDEVLAVGDASFQKKCLGKMSDVAQGGRTVLFVSHNMGAMQSLTDRCMLLEHGRLADIGPTSTIVERYISSLEDQVNEDTTRVARPDPGMGRQVRICRIAPLASRDHGFSFGDDLRFEVDIESQTPYCDLRLAATVCSLDGHSVLATFSPNVINTPASGRITVEFTIQQTGLAPATYMLAMSIGEESHEKPRRSLDIVRPGPVFTVSPMAKEGIVPVRWQRVMGPIIHTRCNVHVRSQPAAEEQPLARPSATRTHGERDSIADFDE